MMLRGFGKLIAIVVAAGLAGAIIGITLAELTGGDDSSAPIASATSTAAPASTGTGAELPGLQPESQTTETEPKTETETKTQTGPTSTTIKPSAPVKGFKVPRVEVVSAQIAPLSSDGGTVVTVRARVTNRRRRALVPEDPVLLEGPDAVELDSDSKDAAGALRKALEPGETASGALRFTVPSAVAQRIRATGKAQLKIATRTINLELEVG